jgi:hypothetical protein
MRLEDGKGNGYELEVDAKNRALVLAISEPDNFFINQQSGKVWSIPWENVVNAGANDYIIYIKNTGDKDLRITDIRLSASAATQVEIHKVTGTAGGSPTAITSVPRNLGSAETPSADLYSDPDITGLTSAGTIFFMHCPVADTLYHIRTSSNIIITKNQAIALLVETTTITTTGVISLVESE